MTTERLDTAFGDLREYGVARGAVGRGAGGSGCRVRWGRRGVLDFRSVGGDVSEFVAFVRTMAFVFLTFIGLVGGKVAAGADEAVELVDLSRYQDVQTRADQDPKLTLVVSISGGGYRAANFALGALLAMEQVGYTPLGVKGRDGHVSNLLNEVDYYSTVSGGGLAAAVAIVARLQAAANADGCSGKERRLLTEWMSEPGVADSLREDHTFRLVTSRFAPEVLLTDKTSGDVLQERLDETVLLSGRQGGECGPQEPGAWMRLKDVLPASGSGGKVRTPFWFMNATDMATGWIVPLTPGWIERQGVAEFWHGEWRKVCREGVPQRECVGAFNVPLALAVRSSMNFPAGIPPTKIRMSGGGHLYLTDGGEADNLGTVTAVDVLHQEGRTRSGGRRLLVVIDAFRGLGAAAYGTARVPGLVESVLRATSLPLDAHRERVKRDFYEVEAHQPTVLDALSEAGDVSVAYVDMEREPLKVGTNLRLSVGQQKSLICAGKRQMLVALGALDAWQRVRGTEFLEEGFACPPDEKALACPEEVAHAGGGCRGILAFNRQGKEALADELVADFVNKTLRARNAVDRLADYLGRAVEENSREKWRDVLSGRFQLGDAPNVGLDASALDTFSQMLDQYVEAVSVLRDGLDGDVAKERDKEVKAPAERSWIDGILGALKDLWNWLFGEEEAESAAEAGAVADNAVENGGGGSTGEHGGGDEEAGTGGGSAVAGSSPEEEDGIRERMAQRLDEMLNAVGTIRRALETVQGASAGSLEELRNAVARLTEPHDEMVLILMELDLRQSPNLRDGMEALTELLGAPEQELDELHGKLEEKFASALAEYASRGARVQKAADALLADMAGFVKGDVEAFWKGVVGTRAADAVDAVGRVGSFAVGRRARGACPFLVKAMKSLAQAHEALGSLDDGVLGNTRSWGTAQEGASRVMPEEGSEVSEQVGTALQAVAEGRATAAKTLCLWPDVDRRDRMTYGGFQSFGELKDFAETGGCGERDRLPYESACG